MRAPFSSPRFTPATHRLSMGAKVCRWTLIEAMPPRPRTKRGARLQQWLCRCDCGTEKIILEQSLISALVTPGQGSKSCGCLAKEIATKHGESEGRTVTVEYRAWVAAKKRCAYPDPNYGGRGISMCAEWLHDFNRFLLDMGRRPGPGFSLDRINNAKGYEPANCRWATRTQQSRNRRCVNKYSFQGVEMTLGEIAESLGISRGRARFLEQAGRLPAERIAKA